MKKTFRSWVFIAAILGVGVASVLADQTVATTTPVVKKAKAKKTKKPAKAASAKQDALSLETAVVIQAKTEGAGEDEEYAWIAQHYPGYTTNRQALNNQGDHSYDIISITTKDGKKVDLIFDISNFLGKF
ncbi:MAG TPA: hypothetical protein VJ873_07760 [bacterium]|nr:hypothetical protein [bacterium]